MPRFILRRSDSASASPAEAAVVVSEHSGVVVNQSDDAMLVDVNPGGGVAAIKGKLPGWIVAPQAAAKIPVPDTRLKIRSNR